MDRHDHESIKIPGGPFDRTPSERPSPQGWSESALVRFLRHSAIGDDRGAWTDMDRHAQAGMDMKEPSRGARGFSHLISGAGGIRTPVPKRAEDRVYACSRPLISFTTRRVDGPSREQGMRMSRSSKACQPFRSSPMICGFPPHRASGGSPSRRSGRESVLRVGR